MGLQNQGGGSVKDENYLKVYGWMMNQYELTNSELLVLAFIFGFDSGYDGSLQYMADSTNMHRINAKKVVDNLVKKGFVKRKSRKGKTSIYTISKLLTHHKQIANTTISKPLTNNNIHKSNYKKGKFTDFEQRVYDFSELEKLIRSN